MHGQLPHAGTDHHEAPGGHQAAAAARGVRRGRQGRRRLPLLPPHPPSRHGREAPGKESMAGSVGNLYSSVERLEGSYLRPGFGKDALLCPAVEASPLLRLPVPPAPAPRTFFMCGTTNQFNYQGCRGYVSDTRGARCPACGNEMATQSQYVAALAPAQPEQGAATATTGYVQGGVT
ncbi:hypothetical protein ZWY2020_046453 [Hordeum vulgare]|nr:hypothetical protein ZWY2020_046453 [Hordeum vulgare]